MKYEVVIGLEVHAQLATETKIFCGCSTQFGSAPNSQVCPVCLGMPGVLPVLNKKVVEYAIKMGLATNSQINRLNTFARKNYFYPDLPKGYQISQFDEPICEHGSIDIVVDGQHKQIGITRIHMEEDAGKSVHDESYVNKNETLVDLNRCGVPLIEIVSEPDMRSAQEAAAYLTKIRQLVRYLGVCDGNMDEGSLRCDANISLRPFGQEEFGTKAELKNMNSIRNVERALEYEIKRQASVLEDGGTIQQETLLWDPVKNVAKSMRGKEDSHDYRYFPDPDLVPVKIDQLWLDEIHTSLPELPDERTERFVKEYKIPEYDAEVLTAGKDVADYYETTVKSVANAKLASNWIMGEVMRLVNQQKVEIGDISITPARLADLLNSIENKTISGSAAKTVFEKMAETELSVAQIVEQEGLAQISDSSELDKLIDQVISENTQQVERYKNGEKKLIGFFVGAVMKASKGKADPKQTNEILRKKLL
ncbi:MAG: Asp-tRNA(Asn)/Glu-tRNA(Gln) amidotransferase subunit GatB [Calditrichaeota bacterium]|nr:MAG: Asp-tRNA(Asn)/Glu-tRNA(Gln) amidotransferase subunit GatB [Calditrichota bacterium]MBL1206929.1 Asp-tRNA(Asn)/Glu-tRNA(Gln) amidotransferase subunit GatB [Calditrichota bacterium]NOG46756.1 Asp-tRNA(Asn)/Glu-tRNA(Gln) amidotransferase subunit GatB [Calditrichota bacterium]